MTQIFPEIPEIAFEGASTRNPLAFRHYNPSEVVGDKTMAEHLRFSLAYWHTFCGSGSDPFGSGTMLRPWSGLSNPMDVARMRMQGNFELATKLKIPFFCFHDRDIAPEGADLAESNRNLDEIVALAKSLMGDHPVKLLWGTANLFSHPRYTHGASTNPDPAVFAYAAAQVKKALEATLELGGENYVFWGGREGYETLLNTDMKRELDQFACFLHLAVDHAKAIGFTGQFLIEPKPREPSKHQYDFDSQSVHAFLQKYDLLPYFKLNIETNHATLAGHTVEHELHYARINGLLGSVDANQGDTLLGWDTDQFPTDLNTTTLAMFEILKNGGLGKGGLNFDAKPRRGSVEVVDIAHAHISGMDAFARGLKAAYKLITEGELDGFVSDRYADWNKGIGADALTGKAKFAELEAYALKNAPKPRSGRQEWLESVVNASL